MTPDELRGHEAFVAPKVQAAHAAGDPFQTYIPPFDLRSDMLFVGALCPVEPLRRSFPGVPFLSLFGKAVLILWFSRIHELCYREASGEPRCLRHDQTLPYNELNVIALLQRRAFFVPGIYATSDLTLRLGHRFGMPKRAAQMSFEQNERSIVSRALADGAQSQVEARLLGSGRWLGSLLSTLWPRWMWPAEFPSGSSIRALVQRTPRVQVALVRAGRLALRDGWLPDPVPLLRLGLYVPGQRMRLPSPQAEDSE